MFEKIVYNEQNDSFSFICANCKTEVEYKNSDLRKEFIDYTNPIDELYSTIHDGFLCIECQKMPFYQIYP